MVNGYCSHVLLVDCEERVSIAMHANAVKTTRFVSHQFAITF